jgi:hypothetical protein
MGSGGPDRNAQKRLAVEQDEHEEHGGHDAPSWTRGVSAAVLLGCTLLYAMVAGKLYRPCLFRNPRRRGGCRFARVRH